MNSRGYPTRVRVSERTARRHRRLASIIPSCVPQDRSLSNVPQYRDIIFENSSNSATIEDNTCDNNSSLENLNPDMPFDYNPESCDNTCDNTLYELGVDEFNFERSFLNVVVKYSLPYSAADELMSIINAEFGYKRLPKTIKTIMRRLDKAIYSLHYRFICNCKSAVSFVSNAGNIPQGITCTGCSKVFNGWFDVCKYPFYVSLPIINQIQLISETFETPSVNESSADNGLCLHLILAIDAIPIFKSVNASLHVMVVFIDGMKKSGKDAIPILSTLYYGRGKPELGAFMSFFLSEYGQIRDNTFYTKWSDQTSVKLKCIIADAPCRAWLLGFQQFNARFGCSRCYIETSASKYPMNTSETLKLRTLAETEQIRKALPNVKHYGVINQTPFSSILDFDYINCTLIEYLHCAILGVTKNLFSNIILDSSWGTRAFINSTRPPLQYFNEKFQLILMPTSIKRFRTFAELSNYKSSEFENLLFYFSYPLFKDKLKPEFLLHILILASAISKLVQPNSVEDITDATKEIDQFLKLINHLNYPDTLYRYNTHSLLHLADDAKRFGPLKKYNAYGYESFLGFLKRLVTSPTNVCQQIIYRVKVFQTINTYSKEIQFKNQAIPDQRIIDTLNYTEVNLNECRFFLKCVQGKNMFKAYDERKKFKRGDYNICLNNMMYQIEYFLDYCGKKYMLARKYKILSNIKLQSMGINVELNYAFYVRLKEKIKLVPIYGILKPIILAKTQHNTLLFKIVTSNN